MGNSFLYFFCILPCILFLFYIYKKDYLEKEPFVFLFFLFASGMMACACSIFVQTFLIKIFPFLLLSSKELSIFELLFKSFCCIALVEESLKWLFLYFITWHSKHFKHVYDPIVYCSCASLGFAALENICYCFSYASYGFLPIFLRGFISVPCHLAFGIIMGNYLGLAKEKRKTYYLFFSFFIPVLCHFCYDFLLMISSSFSTILFGIFLALLFLCSFLIIHKKSRIAHNIEK